MDDDVHSSFLWLRPPKARVLLQVRRKITAILRCSTSVQDIIASLCRGTSGLDIDLRVVDINQVIVKKNLPLDSKTKLDSKHKNMIELYQCYANTSSFNIFGGRISARKRLQP